MPLNSRVGSFEQQNGHQTYNMTDDLRALCPVASYRANEWTLMTDDLGAILGGGQSCDVMAGPNCSLWITTDDVGTFR